MDERPKTSNVVLFVTKNSRIIWQNPGIVDHPPGVFARRPPPRLVATDEPGGMPTWGKELTEPPDSA